MIEDDELLSLAKMGVDAETFIRTPLGKFLVKKAEDEIEAATQDLISADPDDVKSNTELRNRIHVARMFVVWLTDSINMGRSAHERLKEMEENE